MLLFLLKWRSTSWNDSGCSQLNLNSLNNGYAFYSTNSSQMRDWKSPQWEVSVLSRADELWNWGKLRGKKWKSGILLSLEQVLTLTNVIDIDACPQRWTVEEEKRQFPALLDSTLFFLWVWLESYENDFRIMWPLECI